MTRSAPGFFFAMRLLTGVVGVGTPIMLAKSMRVTEFAAYATILAAASLAITVSSLGVDRACLRFLPAFSDGAKASTLMRFLATLAIPRMFALGLALTILILSGLWLPAGAESTLSVPQSHAALLMIFLGLAMGANQLAAAFIQGLLLHRAYAIINFLMVFLRISALGVLVHLYGALTFDQAVEVFIRTEFAAFAAQALVVSWAAYQFSRKAGQRAVAPSLREVMHVSKANYLTYLVGLPWTGPALILAVGEYGTQEMTAAFAFFQTLAERAKSFMPVRLLQSFVEPQWAKSHQEDGRVRRFQVPFATLQKINAMLLSLGLVLVVAVGEPVLREFIRPRYANHVLLAELIIVQQAIGSILDLVWMGLNATNQAALLARMFTLVSLASLPLLIPVIQFGGAAGAIILSCVPSIGLIVMLRRAGVHFARLNLQIRRTGWFLAAGAGAGAIGLLARMMLRPGVEALMSGILAGTLAWIVMMAWATPFNRAERHLLRHFINSRA